MLVCSGLDHAARGFESFARECFAALRAADEIDMCLVKGSGESATRERSVRTLTRDAPLARILARGLRREPFRIEQLAFGLSLQRELAQTRPDVVYFNEWHTGLVLAASRRALRARYQLAYCNGAMAVEGFGHLDRVQELTPISLETVLARGADPRRHTLLPMGFCIAPHPRVVSAEERTELRARLGLPAGRRILLSVAALNRHHKRLDYLIEEVASLPQPRPYLLLDGQPEAETPGLRALARERLGEHGHSIRTSGREDLQAVYRASDAFVLASLGESFGRVLIEATAHGLPCLAHDYPITRYVLGEHGYLADLSRPGALAGLLEAAASDDPQRVPRRHRFAYESFSWDRLRPRYVAFLEAAAQARRHPGTLANSTVSSSRGEKLSKKQR